MCFSLSIQTNVRNNAEDQFEVITLNTTTEVDLPKTLKNVFIFCLADVRIMLIMNETSFNKNIYHKLLTKHYQQLIDKIYYVGADKQDNADRLVLTKNT